jgi:hypothetical protein
MPPMNRCSYQVAAPPRPSCKLTLRRLVGSSGLQCRAVDTEVYGRTVATKTCHVGKSARGLRDAARRVRGRPANSCLAHLSLLLIQLAFIHSCHSDVAPAPYPPNWAGCNSLNCPRFGGGFVLPDGGVGSPYDMITSRAGTAHRRGR